MQKVHANRIKLIIFFKQGPREGGFVMWMRQKTTAKQLDRARKLIDRYKGKFNAAIIYSCPHGSAYGQEIERYNSRGIQIIELKPQKTEA